MDWTETGYSYDISVIVVHQTDVNTTLGSLSGVQSDSIQLGENYYSDSRVQAKLKTVVKEGSSDGYVDNARLRILLTIPKFNFFEELITGYVSDINKTFEHGYEVREYTIESTLWGLLEHKVKDNVVIKKGAKLSTIVPTLISSLTKMQYSTDNMQDHVFGNNIVYEAGSVLATVLFELNESYNRVTVDGHGRLIFPKYTAPSKMTAGRSIHYSQLRNLMVGSLSYSSSEYEAPGRAIVTATVTKTDSDGKSSQQVVVGSYDAPATDPTSLATRGWIRARTDSYSGVSENPSKSELNALAKKNWENAQDKGREWTATSVFADYHIGEVCTLILPNGSGDAFSLTRKVLVKSVTTNFGDFTQELTLKEV